MRYQLLHVLTVHLPMLSSTARGSDLGRPRRLLGAIDLLDATYAGPDMVTDCSAVYVRADDPTRPNDDETSMVRLGTRVAAVTAWKGRS